VRARPATSSSARSRTASDTIAVLVAMGVAAAMTTPGTMSLASNLWIVAVVTGFGLFAVILTAIPFSFARDLGRMRSEESDTRFGTAK
jgi:hypothetical protein